jgi:hypothetical protein
VQLADELEAKQAMAKADWECWKKIEEQFEQIHGLFLIDLDEDDLEQACWDVCTRERYNADISQMAKEIDILPYSPSPSPSLLGSCTKKSSRREWRGKRRTNTGRTVSPNMGRGNNLIKELAEDTFARRTVALGASTSMTTISLMIVMRRHALKVVGSFITVKRGGGLIYTGSLSNIGNKDNTSNDDALGITAVDDNNKRWNKVEAEDMHAIPYHGEAQLIYKIFVEAQGADLRRFDKHEKRATLWTGKYPPVMNCTLFCITQGIDVWMISIPYHLMLYTNGVAE